MTKVPENGQEGVCVKVGSRAPLAVFRESFSKRRVHGFAQNFTRLCSCGFLGKPRLWRFSLGSLQAENVIKLPENCQDGGDKIIFLWSETVIWQGGSFSL